MGYMSYIGYKERRKEGRAWSIEGRDSSDFGGVAVARRNKCRARNPVTSGFSAMSAGCGFCPQEYWRQEGEL